MHDRRSVLADAALHLALLAALGGLAGGCGAGAPAPGATSPASDPPLAPSGASCGADLVAAVHGRSPDYGGVAVARCDTDWAYVGAKEGRGDTEQVWRVEDGSWTFVTGMPSELCPVDLEEQDAPGWVVDLFAYRDYAC